MISAKGRVCGIIANPVDHSMSPLMQNFYGQETGVDFAYMPFKVLEEDVETAIAGAYALNLAGLNVTVPHKQRVMPYLKEIDEDARAIGAVNTLVRIDGGYKGCNTDAAGLWRAMQEEGIEAKGQDCILIGAGGAAKAAAYVLAKEGARAVYILNRNVSRAETLAGEMNERFGRPVMVPMALEEYNKLPYVKNGYLAVQATSVGMHAAADSGNNTVGKPYADAAGKEAPIEDAYFYSMIHTGIDIIYTPLETAFMSYVQAAGGRTMNGLTMLLYQGIEAFEKWNPEVKVSQETVEKAKELVTAGLRG